eukprot:4684919-Amphidinium_carterae.2
MGARQRWLALPKAVVPLGRSCAQSQVGLCPKVASMRPDFEGLAAGLSTASFGALKECSPRCVVSDCKGVIKALQAIQKGYRQPEGEAQRP